MLKNRCTFSTVTSHIGVKEENLPLIDVSFFSFHVSGAATHLKGTDKLSFLTQTPAVGKWMLKKTHYEGGEGGDVVKEKSGGRRGVQGWGGRVGARIDLPPGVMDSAISGSGRRRREESDFCFSKS